MARVEKQVLGTIQCPHCGEEGAMHIKHDKNNEPFGHCEECSGQLRVGGKPGRVRRFLRLYPWAAPQYLEQEPTAPAASVPVTVTVTEPEPKMTTEQISQALNAQQAAKATPARRKATFADALNMLGVANAA